MSHVFLEGLRQKSLEFARESAQKALKARKASNAEAASTNPSTKKGRL